MKRKVYFQFRYAGDGRPWTDIPVRFDSITAIDTEEAERTAVRALAEYVYLVEVRWYWEGSQQGHYVNRDSAAPSIRWLQTREAIKPWQQAARAASEALETFYLQLERWITLRMVPEAEFRQALDALRQEGLEGWFDHSPLNIDKLHALLVEGAWEEDTRPLVERVFGSPSLSASAEDDEYIEAQAEDWAITHS